MDSVTKVRIDLSAHIIELEGREEFVKEQLEKYETFIFSTKKVTSIAQSSNDDIKETASNQEEKYIKKFGIRKELVDTVIHTEGNDFTIITKKIKGGNAEKQINYSLIYCLCKEFYGVSEVSFEELRELCSANSCLDSGNFSKYYNNQKNLFVVTGKSHSKSKIVKLTAPGRKKAKELLISLAEE